MSINGWVILDKPLGLGSTQAVGAVKRCLREAGLGKPKVGHGGTLDPLATGVLPIAIGEATKLAGRMLDATKTYAFTVRFGSETDTLDGEGAEVATSAVRPTAAAVAAVLARFTGPIAQVPPAYSALKVAGQRAYDLARAGSAPELAPRQVTIHALTLFDPTPAHPEPVEGCAPPAAQPLDQLTLEATVSKGTYIRSLARDIALALGTVGHVTMLRRLRAGPFDIASAISLDNLNDHAKGAGFAQAIVPLEAALVDIPALALTPDQALGLRQGRVLTGLPLADGLWLARLGQVPVALVIASDGAVRVERGFNLDVAE